MLAILLLVMNNPFHGSHASLSLKARFVLKFAATFCDKLILVLISLNQFICPKNPFWVPICAGEGPHQVPILNKIGSPWHSKAVKIGPQAYLDLIKIWFSVLGVPLASRLLWKEIESCIQQALQHLIGNYLSKSRSFCLMGERDG